MALTQSKLTAFIATTNRARAKAFYGEVLGLPLLSEDPFALVFDANGTPLRVVAVEKASVAPYAVLGWSVGNIAKTVHELQAAGVTFQRFQGMEQDEDAVWTAPGGAKVTWFNDPEGHVLSISEG